MKNNVNAEDNGERTGKNIAIRAGVVGFDSRADQMGHRVANNPPPLQRFFGRVLLTREAT